MHFACERHNIINNIYHKRVHKFTTQCELEVRRSSSSTHTSDAVHLEGLRACSFLAICQTVFHAYSTYFMILLLSRTLCKYKCDNSNVELLTVYCMIVRKTHLLDAKNEMDYINSTAMNTCNVPYRQQNGSVNNVKYSPQNLLFRGCHQTH